MSDGDPGSLLAELADRQRIEDTLYRYGSAIDAKEWDIVRSLFTDDVVATYGSREPLRGLDALMEWLLDATVDREWQHHLLSVYHVDIDGDTARAVTYHTSHQVVEGRPDDVLVIVARYYDTLRRAGTRWLISEKTMVVGWREERIKARLGSTH